MSLEQKSPQLEFVNTNKIGSIAHTKGKPDTLLGELYNCENWSTKKE